MIAQILVLCIVSNALQCTKEGYMMYLKDYSFKSKNSQESYVKKGIE